VNAPQPMMMFHVPEDAEWLVAWAKVALRHAHLDYVLRMTVRTFGDLEIQEALDDTAYQGSGRVRQRILTLARARLAPGQALTQLEELLERCRVLTSRRNFLVHTIIARGLDEEEPQIGQYDQWGPLPSAAELNELWAGLMLITSELNTARLRGFIFEALGAADRAQ
jgi:hypothetical protein